MAQQLLQNGIELISYGRPVPPGTQDIGDIDIETRDAIVETTIMRRGKRGQIAKLISDCDLNPSKKLVILYAEQYLKSAEADIVNEGGLVVREFDNLLVRLR